MAHPRILISDPHPERAEALRDRLTGLGFRAEVVDAGFGDLRPDLFLVAESTEGNDDRAHPDIPSLVLSSEPGEGRLALPASDRELRLEIELALARHEAARSTDELHAFFTVSLDLFCFLGFDGYFRRLNPAWEKTLGFSRRELMSRPFIEFVHPDDRERTLGQNAQVRGGGQALGFENRYLCKDGSHRWLFWNSTAIEEGGIIYAVARDITGRKMAEQERAELLARLESSLAEVKTLQEILPICSYCRKIRDDEDYWHTVEGYISKHTGSQFSHSICPSCMESEVGEEYR